MLSTTIRRMVLMGIGALSMTRERAEMLVKELTDKGAVDQAEARTFVSELIRRGEQERAALQKTVRGEITALRQELGLVSKRELSQIEARLERIEKHLNLPPLPTEVEAPQPDSRTDERLKRIEEHLNLASPSAERTTPTAETGDTQSSG